MIPVGHRNAQAARRLLRTAVIIVLACAGSACNSLHKAALSGDVATLTKALDAGKDVNLVDKSGRPLLAVAAAGGQVAVVRELLKRGADLELKDGTGLTALYLAAEANHLGVVQELVAAGANVESQNGEVGATPLLPAAENGYRQVVEYLLERKADPLALTTQKRGALALLAARNSQSPQSDVQGTLQVLVAAARQKAGKKAFPAFLNTADDEGYTALNRAAGSNSPALVQGLVQAGANVNLAAQAKDGAGNANTGWSPLHAAAAHCEKSEPTLRALLTAGANPLAKTGNGQTVMLVLAACDGDTALAAKPLLERAKVRAGGEFRKHLNEYDVTGMTALLQSVAHRQDGLLRLLLQAGANPNLAAKSGNQPTALMDATTKGATETVKLLLANGADPDRAGQDGTAPLHLAVDTGQTALAQQLLAGKASPNLVRNGRTLLLQVVEAGQLEMARALLAAGAKPDIADATGRTPLHVAAARGDADAVALLLASRANPNLTQSDGYTPLLLAAEKGFLPVVSALLAGRADPDRAAPDGMTALYAAVWKKQPAIVRELLSARANPDLPLTNEGWTPLHKAGHEGSDEIWQLLVAAGADQGRRNRDNKTPGDLVRERQERLAREAAERERVAQQKEQNSFQWGKFAAMTAGVALGGVGELDSRAQADVFLGVVRDSMAGQQGVSGLQQSVDATTQRLAQGGGSGGGASLATPGGGGADWTPEPNTLEGSDACPGYTSQNYKEYYAANSQSDVQLHSLCAAAFNYYSMYLNAKKQGYSKQEAHRTYEAFQGAASTAEGYFRDAGARPGDAAFSR